MQPSGVWALKPLADMSQAEFRDWQALLEERTGVVINEQRRAFLQTNLTARMRELGVGDYASYFRQVTDGHFAEYYEPFTGEPLGSMQQSWTAASVLDWLD